MKKWLVILPVLVLSISVLSVYFIYTIIQEPQLPTLQVNESVTFLVDNSGNADSGWVYEIPPSNLADQTRLGIMGGTMGGVPVHGIGVENAKLMFSADVYSFYARYGLEMKNVSCDITGLSEGETFRVTMQWKIYHFAYRRENVWEILFQPIDNESYAQKYINDIKDLQSSLSVIAENTPLSFTSKTYIILPAGVEIANESELLGLGRESIDFGGGSRKYNHLHSRNRWETRRCV